MRTFADSPLLQNFQLLSPPQRESKISRPLAERRSLKVSQSRFDQSTRRCRLLCRLLSANQKLRAASCSSLQVDAPVFYCTTICFSCGDSKFFSEWRFSRFQSEQFQIIFDRRDSCDSEFFHEERCDCRRQKCWECRSQVDVLYAERKQCEKDDYRFLLIP